MLVLHYNGEGDFSAQPVSESAAIENKPEESGSYDLPKETEQVGITGVPVIKSDLTGVRNYEKKYPPLIEAAYKGILTGVQKELEAGADPNMRSFDGGTALMYSCRNGDDTDQVKIFDLLVDYGARVRMYDVAGYMPLHIVPFVVDMKKRNYYQEALLKHGARIEDATKLTESSAKVEGQIHTMRAYMMLEIIVNNYDRLGVVDQLMRWGWLYDAKLLGRIREYAYSLGLRYIADEFDSYEGVIPSFRRTALLPLENKALRDALNRWGSGEGLREAEYADEYGIVKVGEKIVPTYHGMTPLMMAVLKRNSGWIERILKESPQQVPVKSTDRYQRTALHMAVLQYTSDIVGMLLKTGSKVDVVDYQGNTPLHLVAYLGDIIVQKKMTPLLIKVSGTLNYQNDLGDTVMHKAVRMRDINYVEYLLKTYEKDLNMNIRNKAGQTPLQLADRLGLAQIVKVLKK
jgi:ankyrin repeat protein